MVCWSRLVELKPEKKGTEVSSRQTQRDKIENKLLSKTNNGIDSCSWEGKVKENGKI